MKNKSKNLTSYRHVVYADEQGRIPVTKEQAAGFYSTDSSTPQRHVFTKKGDVSEMTWNELPDAIIS